MVDMAHFAGLVAAGLHPSPLPHAHVVTTTTHKTLRGPRAGMVLSNDEEIGKKINSAVFPGLQGGPLMHIIAAKAVAFKEALTPAYKLYIQSVIDNAKALGETLVKGGAALVSGGTDTHLMLVDLRPKKLTGKAAEIALGRANITCNKNGVPFDPEKPMVTSGIRLGSPAGTTRGFGITEFQTRRQHDHRGARWACHEWRRGQRRRRGRREEAGHGALRALPHLSVSRRREGGTEKGGRPCGAPIAAAPTRR